MVVFLVEEEIIAAADGLPYEVHHNSGAARLCRCDGNALVCFLGTC